MSGSSMRNVWSVCLMVAVVAGSGGTQAVWAANDVQNGGMETFTSGVATSWTSYYSGGAPIAWSGDNTYVDSGSFSQKIQLKDTNPRTQNCGLYQTIDASVGDAITFVAKGRTYHNNHNYTGLFIGAKWDGSTTPPVFDGEGQGGTTFFTLSTSGNATSNSVTVFLNAKRNGSAGANQLCWFDTAASYHAYVPPAATANNPMTSSLDVNVNPGSNSTNSNAQYAITIGGGAYTLGTNWVQANGSVSTTAVWQTDATWGTKTVTGLASATTYTFQVRARYSSTTTQETSLGTSANGTTACNVGAPTGAAADTNPICVDGSTTLSATAGSNGDEVWWYTDSCGGTQVGTGSGNQTVSPTTTTTYYARTKNSANGCWSDGCASVTVTVNAKPSTPANPQVSPTSVCAGTQATLSATVGEGETVDWYTGSCTGTLAGSGASLQVTVASIPTTYYGRAEYDHGLRQRYVRDLGGGRYRATGHHAEWRGHEFRLHDQPGQPVHRAGGDLD